MSNDPRTPSPLEGAILEMTERYQKSQEKKAWDKLDVGIEYKGRAITLPDDPSRMPTEQAIEALQRKLKDDNQVFRVFEFIDAFPHDGLVAFVKAMQRMYGWASSKTQEFEFFGKKIKNPPAMLSVRTGPNPDDVIQCPIGQFILPGMDSEAELHTMFHQNDKGVPCLVIHGQVKKKDRHLVLELAQETRRIVAAESIYRGKALRLDVTEEGHLDLNLAPEFLDVSDTTEADLLFDQDIMDQIHVNVLVPMKQTERCRKLRIPLKRGVLLEGKFGTGKSLTARMAANVAVQNGWTFVLLNKVQGLKPALEFAKRYSPAVVFAEDIDRIADERDDEMNDLINTIDGVVSKRSEIMTVLTTNFVEKLNPVILRPGRLDAVISLRAPSAKTVERLIRHYAGGLLDEKTSLALAGQELSGQIPASIREAVERAKLSMIGREATTLDGSDLVVAAKTMKNHLALLNPKKDEPTNAEQLARSLKAVVHNGTTENIEDIKEKVNRIHAVVT